MDMYDTQTSTALAVERVRKGVELLNTHRPGWRALIDPAALRMDSTRQCVVGQVFGDYTAGIQQLTRDAGVVRDAWWDSYQWAVNHGFEHQYADGEYIPVGVSYSQLRAEWIHHITGSAQ